MYEKTNSDFVKELCKRAFPSVNGRKFYVEISERPRKLKSYWDGGSRDYYRVVNLVSGAIFEPPTLEPFGDKVEPYIPSAGYALVEHSIFCGKDSGRTVYLHPNDKDKV